MQGVSHGQGELLAQLRPSDLLVNTAYQGGELRTEITLIVAAINSAAVADELDIAIYHDDEGTTLNLSDLIVYETRLKLLQDSVVFQAQHPGSGIFVKPGGSIGVQTLTEADAVTFSIYGITETLAERVRTSAR